jgi:hypothetical protein
MNIALLFFGQLRWMDNPYTHTSYHEHIINKYNTDVFGSFWKPEKGAALSETNHVDKAAPTPNDVLGPEKIQKQYKFTDIEFREPIDKFDFTETLKQKAQNHNWPDMWKGFDGTENNWFSKPNVFHILLSHMNAIQGAGRFLENYIEKTEKEYDLIFLARPDICVWGFPDLGTLPKNNFYLSSHHNKFPDLGFIFPPKYLKTFSNVYDNTVNITDEELYSLWEPNAEALKFNSCRKYVPLDRIYGIPMPLRVVRGNDCRGPRW